MKAATASVFHGRIKQAISIHAAREGGDPQRQYQTPRQARISIHAAREGGDQPLLTTLSQSLTFQSTPPVKAATALNPYRQHRGRISIHAAREGGDGFASVFINQPEAFQSTPPVKAATYIARFYLQSSPYFNPRRP